MEHMKAAIAYAIDDLSNRNTAVFEKEPIRVSVQERADVKKELIEKHFKEMQICQRERRKNVRVLIKEK